MTKALVLYVEDEEDDVLLLQLAWQRAAISHPLKCVSDGEEAIKYLARKGPQQCTTEKPLLVLLDLNLPRKSGFDVLKWIRSQPEFTSLPVIIYTSSNYPPDRARASALGANDYFVKPTLRTEVLEMLRSINDRWLEPKGE